MPKPGKNRQEYETRINRVMDYILRHIIEDLSLTVLAKIANFSPYHFHRLFKAIAGETLNDFVRRVRLEKAGGMLVLNPRDTITNIAMECGFSSQAVFSRAFKEFFGLSPTEWRNGGWRKFGKFRHMKSKIRNTNSKIRNDAHRMRKDNIPGTPGKLVEGGIGKFEIEVRELPARHVAYMRHIGPYSPEIYEFWQRFSKWAAARDLLKPDTVILGVPHNSPVFTEPEKCHYDACITVPGDFQPEGEVNVMDIPGGKYAVCRFRGKEDEHESVFGQIFLEWMPDSGYQPDDRAFYHRYSGLDFYHPDTGILECEICIPVKPL